MTNGEKIRVMNDVELAKFLSQFVDCSTCCLASPKNCRTNENCEKAFFGWLKQSATETRNMLEEGMIDEFTSTV